MVIKSGTDIVNIDRIKNFTAELRSDFAKKILCESEYDEYISLSNKDRADIFLASRFSAKEAISKAFGSGISAELGFKDICIKHNSRHKPYVEFSAVANNFINKFKIISHDLSISHDSNFAITLYCALVEEDPEF